MANGAQNVSMAWRFHEVTYGISVDYTTVLSSCINILRNTLYKQDHEEITVKPPV